MQGCCVPNHLICADWDIDGKIGHSDRLKKLLGLVAPSNAHFVPSNKAALGGVDQVVSGEGGSGAPWAQSESGSKVDRLELLITFRNPWAVDKGNQKALEKVVTFLQ